MFRRLIQWIKARPRGVRDWITLHSLSLTLGVLIAAFFLVFFANRILISIYPGQAGVIWKRFEGTLTDPKDIYSEGFHIISPLNIMSIYNLRFQILRREMKTLTKDGLELTVDVGLLYRVRKDLAGELHQEVGEDYLTTLIIPTLDAAIRNIAGSITAEDVYVRTRHQRGEVGVFEASALENAKVEVGKKYIEVDDLSILRLILPKLIQTAIQEKHQEEQMALLYDYRLQREAKEAQRKGIEAGGIKDFLDTIGGLTDRYLKFKGIEATLELAKSPNTKVVVVGDRDGLPLIGTVPLAAPPPESEFSIVPSAAPPPGSELSTVPSDAPPPESGN